MCWTSFLVSFFPLLFIPCVGCKTPSPSEIYCSPKYILIREHHWIVFSSQIFRLGSFSIHFFYFPHLFINIFSFKNPKNHFSTIDQGFSIFARLFGSFNLCAHFRPFIVQLCFLNIKNNKIISWFQSFNLPLCGFYLNLPLF